MADFGQAIAKVLRHEGVDLDSSCQPVPRGRTGYTDHAKDRGGETNWGITNRVARENGYTGLMSCLPYVTALSIYRHKYWAEIRGDEITDQAIAEEMLDTAINCGPGTAVRFLQRTLNLLNKEEVRYANITEDGRMGPATLATLSTALAAVSDYNRLIHKALNCFQGERYAQICEEDEEQEANFPGWLRWRVGVAGR